MSGSGALTDGESSDPALDVNQLAQLEQERADSVCNFLASPSGPHLTRHAVEFGPSRSTREDRMHPLNLNAFAFASIHCEGD